MRQLLCIYLLLACWTGVCGQSVRTVGGAGFLRIGQASLHRAGQTLDQFTPASGISNDFVYIGGEGYARLNNYILGGGGYGLAQHNVGSATYHADPFCGGGYLYVGRIVIDQPRFWCYPTLGVGMSIVGLSQRRYVGSVTQESSVMLPSVNLQLGLGADWLLVRFHDGETMGGLLLGLRAGYQLSPVTSGWQQTGDLPGSDRPRYATNGYFVTLSVGIGAFHRQHPLPKDIVH